MQADSPNSNPVQPPEQVTHLLREASTGSSAAIERLLPLVYDELMRIARGRMAGERAGHTLQATALVHEAFIRLTGRDGAPLDWSNRAHFFFAAAEAMRRILIDHARTRATAKRGGGRQRERLDAVDVAAEIDDSDDFLALDAAIQRLHEHDPLAAQVVRLRYLAGLGIDDTAAALGLSPRSVKREWAFAKAWLYQELRIE